MSFDQRKKRIKLLYPDTKSASLTNTFFLYLLRVGNKYLRQLCVKGNRYDPGNNDSLAEMLTSNNKLTDLDLGTCDLRGKSALKNTPQSLHQI